MLDDLRSAWTTRGPARPLSPWSPGEPVGSCYHYIGGLGHFVVQNHAECLDWVLRTEAAEENGLIGTHDLYSAISYNILVCPHGRTIEGRGAEFQSGAQLHGNSSLVAILFMMDIEDPVTPDLARGATNAFNYVLTLYPWARQQFTHHEVADNPTGTVCAGSHVQAWKDMGGALLPPPPPVYPKPDPTTFREMGDVAHAKQATVSMVLDGDGHGWKDVPTVARSNVVGLFVHAADPATIKAYLPVPNIGLADVPGKAETTRVVLTGGWPHGKYAVSVTATA